MKIKDIKDIIEAFAPAATAEAYDNVGLIVGDEEETINGIMLAVDATEMVISEAVEKGCNLIISHHPIIFHPLKSVTEQNYVGRTVAYAIRSGVNLFAAHTNADKMPGNMSEQLAERLGGRNIRPIVEGGYGVIFDINAITFKALIAKVRDVLQAARSRSVGNLEDRVESVAIVSGAGGGDDELIAAARAQGAQVYISGEFRYDVALSSMGDRFNLVEVGHFLSEKSFTAIMKDKLTDAGVTAPMYISETESNPYN